MNYCEFCGNIQSSEKKAFPQAFFSKDEFNPNALLGFTIEGKYKLEKLISVGNTASVFYAKHRFINNSLAVKILHPTVTSNPTITENFLYQARVLAFLEHPNIIKFFDFGQIENLYYLVTEFIEGYTLKQYLEDKKQLSLNETVQIMSQICAAIENAHKHQIIHQDIKIENVLLVQKTATEIGVKILNFRDNKGSSVSSEKQEIPLETLSCNKLSQPILDLLDFKEDIVDLGVMAFQLLTGNSLLENPLDVKLIRESLSSLQLANSEISLDVGQVLLRALEKDPDKCFDSASEFASELVKVVSDQVKSAYVFSPKLKWPKPQLIQVFSSKSPTVQLLEESYELPRDDDYNSYGESKFEKPKVMVTQEKLGLYSQNEFFEDTTTTNSFEAEKIGSTKEIHEQPLKSKGTFLTENLTQNEANQNLDRIKAEVKPKLLLVINSASIIMIIKKYMERRGFEVIAITESLQAVATILEKRPDLVILGLDLPKLNGGSLCRILKLRMKNKGKG